MIRLQNVPKMAVHNFTLNRNKPKTINTLERTPQFDTVNFTGKKPPVDELNDDDIIELSDDDMVSEPVYIELDDFEAEDERRRKQQEETDIQVNNDIIMYSMLLDEMNGEGYDMNDDYSSYDNGIDDLGF